MFILYITNLLQSLWDQLTYFCAWALGNWWTRKLLSEKNSFGKNKPEMCLLQIISCHEQLVMWNMNTTALLVTVSQSKAFGKLFKCDARQKTKFTKLLWKTTNPSTYTRSSTSMRKKKEMTRETASIALLTSSLPLERDKSTMTRIISTMISTRPKTLQIRREAAYYITQTLSIIYYYWTL